MQRCSVVSRRFFRLVIGLTATLALASASTWVAGCSSDDESNNAATPASANGDAAVSSPPPATENKGGISFPDAGKADDETPKPTDQACAKEGSKEACMTCCSNEHTEGAKARIEAILSCVCTADRCKTSCSTEACAATPSPPDGGGACATCIQSSLGPDGGCGMEIAQACASEPCKSFVACASACEKLQ